MTDSRYGQGLIDQLVAEGLMRHNGQYRNGQPVYVTTKLGELAGAVDDVFADEDEA